MLSGAAFPSAAPAPGASDFRGAGPATEAALHHTRPCFRTLLVRSLLVTSLLAPGLAARGQTAPPAADRQQEEVVRVETELVQTDVSVVDRRGRFVEGLRADDFELRVDGRPQAVSFFETVTAGGADEERKLRAAGRRAEAPGDRAGRKPADAPPPPSVRGRVIFFFVDDVHLGPDSLGRVRKALLRFVDEQMGANDLAAVVSTSGQIGFLQQLTDNRAVLREAVERLHNKRQNLSTDQKVPISEVDANRIANHRDRELFAYLVEATQVAFQTRLPGAPGIVRNRVNQIDAQSRVVEQATLRTLEGLMRSSAPLPGRKLVFFISDGFIVDVRKSNAPAILRRVTEEAARVGAVVYTMDARGLFHDSAVDAGRNDYSDFGPRTVGRSFFETKSLQEPLMTLAAETGGRAFINNNSLNDAFAQAAGEASRYYLLAWRPDSAAERAGQSRVEVVVKGRPDLRVQARRRFFSAAAVKAPEKEKTAPLTQEEELRDALVSLYPLRGFPLSLAAGFLEEPQKGLVLVASMQLDSEALGFAAEGGDERATLDVQGAAVDDRGSFASFRQTLTVSRARLREAGQRFVTWNQQLPLPPGLYQVRVAARDRQTGRAASQSQWLEIPAAAPAGLSVSSIFLGELPAGKESARQSVAVNVSRRFARGSRLRYQTYVHAPAGLDPSDLRLELKLIEGDRAVAAPPPGRPTAAGDPRRLSLSGELGLEQLAPGRYDLRITVSDPRTKTTVTRQVGFTVE
jgi:VWFA-related protein